MEYDQFEKIVIEILEPYKDCNFLIYGADEGGYYIKWLIQKEWHKSIKGMIDKEYVSRDSTILHLMSLYYIYAENDIIINVSQSSIIDDVEAVGDRWENTEYVKTQVLDLWKLVYGKIDDNKSDLPQLTYYDWLEYKYELDLKQIVKKDKVKGKGAHGYYPINILPLIDIFEDLDLADDDGIVDFGAGKGSGIIALKACGFKHILGIEYTDRLYYKCVENLDKLGWNYSKAVSTTRGFDEELIMVKGDARDLACELLERYNYFYFFNPFEIEVFKEVFSNISESFKRKHRRGYIVYAEPMGHSVIMESGLFELFKVYKKNYYECVMWFYVYRYVGVE